MTATIYLDMEGSPYWAEILFRDPRCESVQLTRVKPGGYEPDHSRQYECSRELCADLARTLPDGRACTCPDFTRRHAGTGSAGCKHLRALASVRLLEPGPSLVGRSIPPEQVGPDARTRARMAEWEPAGAASDDDYPF